MAPLRVALIGALGALLLAPQAAMAGGWWSHVEVKPSTVAAGQRVELDEEVMFGSVEEAREAGRFYVYLLRHFDESVVEAAMRERDPGDWWSLGDAQAIRVAQVDLRVSDANLGTATAAFTVPDLPPASYHLMLCDAGCAAPLADVIPTANFTVVADRATAQLAQRVERLERRARRLRTEVRRARAMARNARAAVGRLERRMASAASDRRGSPRADAGWLGAAAFAGALVLLAARRARRT